MTPEQRMLIDQIAAAIRAMREALDTGEAAIDDWAEVPPAYWYQQGFLDCARAMLTILYGDEQAKRMMDRAEELA